MAGVETEYPGSTPMNSLNYFGLDITAAGLTVPPEDNGYQVLSRHSDSQYRSVVLKDDCVVGMICIGDIERSGILCSLIREAVPLQGLEEELLADDFGLVSLPRARWEGQLTAPAGRPVAEETEGQHPEEYVSGE
jgi:NAD(P)H-nitrite reductase large subunit